MKPTLRQHDADDGKNSGETRDFGFGLAIMQSARNKKQQLRRPLTENLINPSHHPNRRVRSEEMRFLEFQSVPASLVTDVSKAGLERLAVEHAISGWPEQNKGINYIPKDFINDTVPIVRTTIKQKRSRLFSKTRKISAASKSKNGRRLPGSGGHSQPTSANVFVRKILPDEIDKVRVTPIGVSEAQRLLAINPFAFRRECPVALCPADKSCPHPGGTCCADGLRCCPHGSSCLNSKPPLCVWNSRADPDLCDFEQCDRTYSCPFSVVPACCRGGHGRSCCRLGFNCVAGDPPSCLALSDAAKPLQLAEYGKLLDDNEKGLISLYR